MNVREVREDVNALEWDGESDEQRAAAAAARAEPAAKTGERTAPGPVKRAIRAPKASIALEIAKAFERKGSA